MMIKSGDFGTIKVTDSKFVNNRVFSNIHIGRSVIFIGFYFSKIIFKSSSHIYKISLDYLVKLCNLVIDLFLAT